MLVACVLAGCTRQSPAATQQTSASSSSFQAAGGHSYQLLGTQVWDVPDPVARRDYQVFVSLPASYDHDPKRHYPVLYVTDADYAFPVIRQIARRLNGDGARISEFILVGLSYAKGEDGMASRRRDYTPTAGGTTHAPAGAVYGHGRDYQAYLKQRVLPFIAGHYRTDEAGRYFLGHSYGGLFGAQVLLSDPSMFFGYVLGSPSLWYDHHSIFKLERDFIAQHHDLSAHVYMYVGEYEQVRPGDARFAGNENNMVSDERTFAQLLESQHYPSLHLNIEVLNDEDHLSVAPRGATHGLEQLLPVSSKTEAKP